MALSLSLATVSFIGLVSLAGTPGAPCGEDGIAVVSVPQAGELERIAKEANELKAASQWDGFRSKLKYAEQVHRGASDALAEQRKILDQAQKDLDAALARIERPRVMIQAIVSEVQDLDGAVLKAACARVSAEHVSHAGGNEPVLYTLSSEAAGRLLATIEKRRPMQVISRPSILALDGQIAEVTVGQQVKRPVSARKSPKDEVVIEERDETVGLVVSLIPTIQDSRQMRLQLTVNNSTLSGDLLSLFVNADGSVIGSPIVDSRRMQTTLQTGDGRTVLLAVKSKKPADETEPTKTTLILLTPRIVDRTAAAGEILHH